MLTKEDHQEIQKNISSAIDQSEQRIIGRMNIMFDEQDQKLDQKLNEKLGLMPTKEEFYNTMDEVMGELKAIREEHSVSTYQLSNHEKRITKLESRVLA